MHKAGWRMRRWSCAVLLGAVVLAGPKVWADAGDALSWGNTVTAAAESYPAPEAHAGKMVLGLLVVLGLMGGLAWWVARRRRQGPVPAAGGATHILACNRFNATQTFMLWEEQGKIIAGIYKKQNLEMWLELPGVSVQRPGGARPQGESPKTFQELWWGLLKSQKRG